MLLLTPFAVLLVIFMFGFLGCNPLDDFSEPPFPTYQHALNSESLLVAYWRLGEPNTTPVPSTGTVKDEKADHPGNYNSAAITQDVKRHSFGASGNLGIGVKPGLLVFQSDDSCIEPDGGFVEVPFDALLNPSPFTFEAWIVPEFSSDPQNNFYCLVESSAPEGGVQKKFGFGLYAGPANPASAQPQPYQWQVWMGNGQNFQQVAVANDNVHFDQLTYLALTFDPGVANNNLILFLYYPDTGQDLSMNSVAPLQAAVTNFKPNNNPGGGSFLVGMGRNLFPGVTVDPVPLQPFLYAFKGKIQEAALYSAALGISKLSSHEMAGGNV